ncbi:MAG: hypothetical protein ABW092_02115 [Candidatus Thiodiazotropha sp.]
MCGRLIRVCLTWIVLLSVLVPQKEMLADESRAGLLKFAVQEANGNQVTRRLLVTPKMLRIEQLGQDKGYILYDREAMTIYSVTPEERSILVIQPQPESVQPPQGMRLKVERLADFDGPAIGGNKPQHWRLIVNDTTCRNVILVPGLMLDALKAYGDYLALLANQHYLSLGAIPDEYRDSCDDAIHVFAPDLLLKKGLPIRVWDQLGNRERLLDYASRYQVSSSLFQLPADYEFVPMRSVP